MEKNRGVVGLKPTRAPLEPQLEGTSSEPQSTWSYVNGSAQIGDGFGEFQVYSAKPPHFAVYLGNNANGSSSL